MSKLSKELIRQIIADGEFSTPNDIGEYLKDMFKDVIQEMLEKELALKAHKKYIRFRGKNYLTICKRYVN